MYSKFYRGMVHFIVVPKVVPSLHIHHYMQFLQLQLRAGREISWKLTLKEVILFLESGHIPFLYWCEKGVDRFCRFEIWTGSLDFSDLRPNLFCYIDGAVLPL